MRNSKIEVNSLKGLVAKPITIKISGLHPEKEIALKASTKDEAEIMWVSFRF